MFECSCFLVFLDIFDITYASICHRGKRSMLPIAKASLFSAKSLKNRL